MHLQRQANRQVRSEKCTLRHSYDHLLKQLRGTARVAVGHDGPPTTPTVPTIDFEMTTLLQQLAAKRIGRAQPRQLVSDNERTVGATREYQTGQSGRTHTKELV